MQTSKLKPVLAASSINKIFHRYVAVNSTVPEADVTTGTKLWQEIPGPSSLPLIGQYHHFFPGGSLYNLNVTKLIEKVRATYGPIVRMQFIVGKPPLIMLFDAESSAQVLRGENWMPIRPGFFSLEYYRATYKKNNHNEPNGLVIDHGDRWKQFRTTVNPAMLQPKTIKLYSTIQDQVAQEMIARLKALRGEDKKLKCNLDTEMNLWALESIGVVALGDRLNCFDPNLPEDSPAKKLIQVVHDFFIISEKLDFRPSLWRFFATPNFKKAMKIYEDQEKLTKYFVERTIKKLNAKEKSDDEKGVLEKLLEIDRQIAITMASDMLFAGVDTTSNAMIYIMYLLATNSEKQEKLREEVMTQNERRPYLRACIKESMRLLPIVSGNVRQTSKEYNLLGYKIPKDFYVLFTHQEMSVSEDHYKRPKEFLPERWLVPKDDPLYHGNAHPFAYSPFGFGVRSCIGRRIAELEMETFLARIMQNFKIEWFGDPLNVKQSSINYAAPPFNFIFKDV